MAARVKKRSDTSTNRDSDKIIVRLPAGMRNALAEVADRNGRSVNAEVVHALAIYFAQEGMTADERLRQGIVVKLKAALDGIIREVAADEVSRFRQKIEPPAK